MGANGGELHVVLSASGEGDRIGESEGLMNFPPLEGPDSKPADHPIAPVRALANLPLVLQVRCAWCKQILQEGSPGAPESHGICPPCERVFRSSNADLLKAMEPLPEDLRVAPPIPPARIQDVENPETLV